MSANESFRQAGGLNYHIYTAPDSFMGTTLSDGSLDISKVIVLGVRENQRVYTKRMDYTDP